MNKNITQIGLLDNEKNCLIGLRNVIQSGGACLLGDSCRVNLGIQIVDPNTGNLFPISIDTEISIEQFELLKTGNCTATVGLAPITFPEDKNEEATQNAGFPTPAVTEEKQKIEYDFLPAPQKAPVDNGTKKKGLGTSGTKKYYQNTEVSWRDVVILAKQHLGRDVSLPKLYSWAESNVTWMMDGKRASVSHIKNWQASIRQNRRAVSDGTEKPVAAKKPVQRKNTSEGISEIERDICKSVKTWEESQTELYNAENLNQEIDTVCWEIENEYFYMAEPASDPMLPVCPKAISPVWSSESEDLFSSTFSSPKIPINSVSSENEYQELFPHIFGTC